MQIATLKTALFFLLLIASTFLYAQPVNDDPCGAIELTLEAGAGCVPSEPIAWTDATATPGIPNPTCASYTTGDVWFKFTLTEPSDIFITTGEGNGGSGITDGGMQLYNNNGACDEAFYAYNCDDDAGSGSMPQIAITALAAGTYYIRFWDYADKTSANIGGICIATNPVTVATSNDDPCTAMVLDVNSQETCSPTNPISWSFASGTSGLAFPSCGSYKTGDIWFTFTLTDTSDVYIKTAAGTGLQAITDGALALYSSEDCNGELIELACVNNQGSELMPELSEASRLPGQYYIRFWDVKDSTSGNIGGICVAALPSVISVLLNDDPCGAIELPVIQDTTCTPNNLFTWSNATGSAISTNHLCGSYETGDIWFKFTLAEKSDVFITTLPGIGGGAITDGAMALYATDACDGTFTFAFCNDDSGPGSMPQIKERAIPAGDYYIRFWDYEDKISGNIEGICVAATASSSTAPNDNCFTAIAFPDLPADGSCASVLVNTEGATGDSINICGGIADDDVWYSFTVPPGATQVTYHITENGNPVPEIIRLHRGLCDDLLFLDCHEESDGLFTDLIGGQVYTIRTHTIDGGVEGHYSICLSVPIPPVNDEPCGAITLIPQKGTNDCMSTGSFTWENATSSNALADPPCGSFSNGDVWFKFELTELSDIFIRTFEGTGENAITDGAFALYKASPDCNSLTYITCIDDQDADHLMPVYKDFAQTAGTYYIRFWDYHDMLSGKIGGICVAANPSISTAGNDLCTGAVAFPIIPVDGTCASVEVNNAGSTGSPSDPVPGYNDDDLWYSFVVPDGINRLFYEITTLEGNNQHVLCVTTACGIGGSNDCFEKESGLLEGLVSGQTYYIRVYTGEQNVPSIYSICLRTPPPPPSNDECEGALSFPTIQNDASCSTVHVNTTWATSSGFFTCGNGENDLWYTFTMPADETDLLIDIITTGRFESEAYEVFSGPCDNLQSILCLTNYGFESSQLHNLTPGETYYLRAFTHDPRLFEFDICLHTPKIPPVNDECPQAIAFPPLPLDGTCASVIANVTGATGDNSPACTYIYDDDVWYTFTLPVGYSGVIITTTPITVAAGVGIYSGNCDSLTLVGCHSFFESAVTGLTGGETYYVRAHSAYPNLEGSFEICLRLATPIPENDNCIDAIPFPEIPLTGEWVTESGTTLSATGIDLPSCSGFSKDDVWYSFIVPEGVHDILFTTDHWDPYLLIELFAGDCDNLISLLCTGSSNEDEAFHNLVPGQQYFLRVYNQGEYYFSEFEISLSVPQPIMNDNCDEAIAFPPLPEDGSCVYVEGNNGLATVSGIAACGNSQSPDIWYTFQMPGQHTSVSFEINVTSAANIDVQLFEGDCGNLVSKECILFPFVDDFSGLTPGQTYHLRILPDGVVDFNICLRVNPLPQANDDCINATTITGNPGVFIDPGPQTTDGATDSDLDMCYPANQTPHKTYDVWYSFVTDEDGGDATITVSYADLNSSAYSFFDVYVQGLEGECDDFTTLSCVSTDFDVTGYKDTILDMQFFGLDALTKYYFRVFPSSATGNYAQIDFTVFAEGTALDPMTGLIDPTSPGEIPEISKVYPSPASSLVHIDFTTGLESDVTLYVTDLLGHVVYHRTQFAREGENHFSIQASSFPPGLYLLMLEKNGIKSEARKVVIQ